MTQNIAHQTQAANANRMCQLLGIRYPIIQAGMVWVSGGTLAAASCQAGILGVIGAGSMNLELLQHHIQKAQAKIKPELHHSLAVNIPLLYSGAREQIDLALKLGIKVFITSAGSAKLFTPYLKDQGCVVIHVVSTPELAMKCEQAGVDAVVAEGFEAGGHNGRDELTTMVLIPQVVAAVKIPVIAAGGIIDGKQMAAAFCLGAEGVQMGTRFVMTEESSAHEEFKQKILQSRFDATMLMMKKYVPVRLMKNKFFEEVKALEERCASVDELKLHLGKGRAKKGMLEGKLDEGELEIGQGCSQIKSIMKVQEVVNEVLYEYEMALRRPPRFSGIE